jgi:ubiquinone/menaquinone biosynthesis C-methylase UbiE
VNWKISLISFLEPFRKLSERPLERLSEIGLRQGMTFLDVGCALGFYSFYASSIVGERGMVYAIDLNLDFIEYVKRKANAKGIKNINAIVADAQETSLPSKSVDVVFLHLVLHDVKDKHAALKEFNRILKANAKLVIDEENVLPQDHISQMAEDSGFKLLRRLRKTMQIFEKVTEASC